MTLGDGVTWTLSVGAIAIGCFAKNFGYATGVVYTDTDSKRAPTWMGRLAFIGVGVLLLVPELVRLFSH